MDIKELRARRVPNAINPKPTGVKSDSFWLFLNKDIRFGNSRLSNKTKEDFYIELNSMLEAGIDARTAMEIVLNEQKRTVPKQVFRKLLSEVVEGVSLSQAMKMSGEFTAYEYYSIQIGEETGKLTQVLRQLALNFQKRINQKRQIITAITYPIVVLFVAFAAVSFMISYVVPMFSDTFKRFGSDLPRITKAVISFSSFLNKFGWTFLIAIITLITILFWQRRKSWFRKLFSGLILKTPVIGSIVQKNYLSRFAATMGLLTGSKVPILQAIQLTRQMISFYPIESSLNDIELRITEGMPLYKSLARYSVYPSKMVSVIKVAEEVNQLELFFNRLADQYAAEVEYQTSTISRFIEPFIIVFLGLIVGIILIAMYLPLFKLGQGF